MADTPQYSSELKLRKLKNTYLFNIFTEDELNDILNYCEDEIFPAYTIVFEEGDQPDKFYIIITGEVAVYQSVPGKRKVTLATLREGDFFGEMSLLDSFPRSATAKTEKQCYLLSMTFQRFDELMNQKKKVGIKWLWTFCRMLSSRLRDTNEKYKQVLVDISPIN